MINALFPIYFLIFSGFLAKKKNIFKDGDQRVLNLYVYYFSLPMLFFVELSKLEFSNKLIFISLVAVVPLFLSMAIFKVLPRIFKRKFVSLPFLMKLWVNFV